MSAVAPDIAETFAHAKYATLPSLISRRSAARLAVHALGRSSRGELSKGVGQVPGTPFAYADPVMERLLARLRPRIERLSGVDLYPTYSLYRVYKQGDRLAPHLDRPACEISVSLNLSQQPDAGWPLWVEGTAGVTASRLAPGDALLYRGTECRHWREPYEGQQLVQVFLHYVDRNGPHADCRFDRREGLRLR